MIPYFLASFIDQFDFEDVRFALYSPTRSLLQLLLQDDRKVTIKLEGNDHWVKSLENAGIVVFILHDN